jgi:hypothetical protein
MVTKKKAAAPKRPTTDVDDVHLMATDAASRTDVPTLPRVNVTALRRRCDLSVEQWRELAALFADQRNDLADLLENAQAGATAHRAALLSSTEQHAASSKSYGSLIEGLVQMLALQDEFRRAETDAIKGKRLRHKTYAAQVRLCKWFEGERALFVEAHPKTPPADTAVVDWWEMKLDQALGRRTTKKELAARSKTLRNRLSAARKALAPNPKKRLTSG